MYANPAVEPFADYDPQSMRENMETLPPASAAAGGRVSTMSPSQTTAPLAQSVDLLPKPTLKTPGEFGEFAPTNLGSQNFIDSTKLIGLDTVGSSLRNASYDLRKSPAIVRKDVGPWANSTITDPDLYRRNLDC
jgi:hypothetical protein